MQNYSFFFFIVHFQDFKVIHSPYRTTVQIQFNYRICVQLEIAIVMMINWESVPFTYPMLKQFIIRSGVIATNLKLQL